MFLRNLLIRKGGTYKHRSGSYPFSTPAVALKSEGDGSGNGVILFEFASASADVVVSQRALIER